MIKLIINADKFTINNGKLNISLEEQRSSEIVYSEISIPLALVAHFHRADFIKKDDVPNIDLITPGTDEMIDKGMVKHHTGKPPEWEVEEKDEDEVRDIHDPPGRDLYSELYNISVEDDIEDLIGYVESLTTKTVEEDPNIISVDGNKVTVRGDIYFIEKKEVLDLINGTIKSTKMDEMSKQIRVEQIIEVANMRGFISTEKERGSPKKMSEKDEVLEGQVNLPFLMNDDTKRDSSMFTREELQRANIMWKKSIHDRNSKMMESLVTTLSRGHLASMTRNKDVLDSNLRRAVAIEAGKNKPQGSNGEGAGHIPIGWAEFCDEVDEETLEQQRRRTKRTKPADTSKVPEELSTVRRRSTSEASSGFDSDVMKFIRGSE